MSNEIMGDQEMILLLSKKNAEERLAAFLHRLSTRFAERGFSAREFRLSMTRGDIGNYLGLTVETISRLLGRFQKLELIGSKVNTSLLSMVHPWLNWLAYPHIPVARLTRGQHPHLLTQTALCLLLLR